MKTYLPSKLRILQAWQPNNATRTGLPFSTHINNTEIYADRVEAPQGRREEKSGGGRFLYSEGENGYFWTFLGGGCSSGEWELYKGGGQMGHDTPPSHRP